LGVKALTEDKANRKSAHSKHMADVKQEARDELAEQQWLKKERLKQEDKFIKDLWGKTAQQNKA